jgi:hypothetical protein
MNKKRMLIALSVGVLSGLFCAYGTKIAGDQGKFAFPVTAGLLASTFYSRVLIGLVVGLSGNIRMNLIWRGASAGIIVSMAMAIYPLLDGQGVEALSGAGIIIAFGAVYGIIADVLATKFSIKKINEN